MRIVLYNRKVIYTLALFLGFLDAVHAQAVRDSFSIIGNINMTGKGTMMLSYLDGQKTILDSADIKNGLFFFNGSVKLPTPARLFVKGSRHQYAAENINFYLENSLIQIYANKDSMNASIVKGSRSNDDKDSIDALLTPYYECMRSLRNVRDFATGQQLHSLLEDIDKIYDELPGAQRKIIVDYALAHPGSYAITNMLSMNFTNNQTELPLLKKIYDHFSASVKASVGGQDIAGLIKRMERVEVGNAAPDFTLPDQNGNPVRLSSFKGKYVLIDFWASWCVPCRKETPFLGKAYDKYKSKNFTIVSISLDVEKDKQKWLDAIHKDEMLWPNLSSLKGYEEVGVRQLFSVQGIPDNFLINPDGVIIARGLRGLELEKELALVLK
jgi:peroxiredoxin